MKDYTPPEETLFQSICPGATVAPKDDDSEESDEDALERLGFSRALARLRGDEVEDDEEIQMELLCPSQRGYGAVNEEYSRMGISFED